MAHHKLKDSFNAEPTPEAADEFVRAAGRGDNTAVTAFLNKYSGSVDVFDVRVYVHRTALMRAAASGHKDTVELLLKNGADVNKENENGLTALSMAADYGRTDIIDLLLKNGADINNTGTGGWTALMRAVWHMQVDTVKLLLEKGADTTPKDYQGKTALIHAQELGQRYSADKNIKDGVRDEWVGKLRQIETLLEKGPAPQPKKPLPCHFKL